MLMSGGLKICAVLEHDSIYPFLPSAYDYPLISLLKTGA